MLLLAACLPVSSAVHAAAMVCAELSTASAGPPAPPALPPQDDDIPGIVRYHTYEVLQKEVQNPRVR